MSSRLQLLTYLLGFLFLGATGAAEVAPPTFTEAQKTSLEAGATIVLEKRPDEKTEIDKRFVTVAAIVQADRELVFSVVNDKENAEDFVDGVLESEVVKTEGNEVTVQQRTIVGGPKGSYQYTLLHKLDPPVRADFHLIDGEMKDVEGTWWFYEGVKAETCLLIYSLYIDAGFFAPQLLVKSGMKKSMPGTIQSIVREVARRKQLELD